MKLVEESFEITDLGASDGYDILKKIERAGRTCYKSEDKITTDSSIKFVRSLIKSGHHSVIEHHNVTVKIITNRGVTHELVRHRLASYSQESTRYCDYAGDGEMEFITPVWFDNASEVAKTLFINTLRTVEASYKWLRKDHNWTPQQAREVLPNALKTEIIMTANLREWRHIFNLRCSKAAHPQIRSLMLEGLKKMWVEIPVIFDDIYETYTGGE